MKKTYVVTCGTEVMGAYSKPIFAIAKISKQVDFSAGKIIRSIQELEKQLKQDGTIKVRTTENITYNVTLVIIDF